MSFRIYHAVALLVGMIVPSTSFTTPSPYKNLPFISSNADSSEIYHKQALLPTNHVSKFSFSIAATGSESDEASSPLTSSSGRKKRRKRKKDSDLIEKESDVVVDDDVEPKAEVEVEVEEEEYEEEFDEQSITSNRFVEVEVRDIRDVLSGSASSSSSSVDTSSSNSISSVDFSNDDGDDKMKSLLADAKRFGAARASEKGETDEEENPLGDKIRGVLETIVTIDFFVVCGFLLWFLAGIFSSSVLKNDAIQLAFNGIFETLVQPALGILMLASAASAMGKKDDE